MPSKFYHTFYVQATLLPPCWIYFASKKLLLGIEGVSKCFVLLFIVAVMSAFDALVGSALVQLNNVTQILICDFSSENTCSVTWSKNAKRGHFAAITMSDQ